MIKFVNKRKTILVLIFIIVVIVLIMTTNGNQSYMKIIKKIIEDTGIYYDYDYNFSENDTVLLIRLFDRKNVDYQKVARKFDDFMHFKDEYGLFKNLRIDIAFADYNSKEYHLFISNYDANGHIHENFDVAKVKSKYDNFSVGGFHPINSEPFNLFKRLELGEWSLQELKWITDDYCNVKTITCYVFSEGDFLKYCDFVHDFMPDCEVINLQTDQ